jgi:hypothetical protein
MKKLIPDTSLNRSRLVDSLVSGWRRTSPRTLTDYGIEFYKGKTSKFWDGMLVGIVLGYIPYLWHMYI